MLRAAIIRCAGSPSVRCFKIARANSTPHRLISTFSHQQELMNSEKLFVVDEFDNVINVATKRDCHLRNNGDKDKGLDLPPLHRAFSVFHFSPPMGGTQPGSRNLLLTQRAANKLLFPLHWSNTCCSHPTTADVIRDAPTLDTNCPMSVVKRAAKRKMLDEVGMAVDSSDLVFVGKYRYHAISPDEKNLGETWGENEVDYVLISSTGSDYKCNPEETADARWVSKGELRAMLENNSFSFTPWAKLLFHRHLFKWWEAVEKGGSVESEGQKVEQLL
eukprot:Selendium_serpulae@DN4081_c0_g1_i1.p1